MNINGAEGVCTGCGAEYDVIRHARGRDFSKSAEVTIDAQKVSTTTQVVLYNLSGTERMENKTVDMGTSIMLYAMFTPARVVASVKDITMRIYHRVDTGAWELIKEGPTDISGALWINNYQFATSGKHSFYGEFLGNAYYAGCPSTVHGLLVSGEYSTSPTVSVEAQPALSVIVKDMIFRKPIAGARVVVDAFEALTDSSGMAVFDALTPGAYTLTVSAKDYKTTTRSVELTTAGMVVEVHLIHVAAIALGIVSVASVGIVVVHKALKRK